VVVSELERYLVEAHDDAFGVVCCHKKYTIPDFGRKRKREGA